MSEQTTTDAPATGEPAAPENPPEPKPTDTVDFWKQKAREQEKRAKDNAVAAKRLTELEESQKTEAEKVADRIAKADAEVTAVPSKVSDALRSHLVDLHEISDEDAELFLNAQDPETLLKQASRLLGRAKEARKGGNHVPREGRTTPTTAASDEKQFVTDLFGSG